MTSSGRKPVPGDTVILEKVPFGLLDDLPAEDQRAISEIVGKSARLNHYDEGGRAEVEFTDSEGDTHFIYVNPDVLRLA